MSVEEEYQDVLQNIEAGIVSVYRQDNSLLDYDVQSALEALIRSYGAEQSGRQPPQLRLSEKARGVFDAAKSLCELRMGRLSPTDLEQSMSLKLIRTQERGGFAKLVAKIFGQEDENQNSPEAAPISLEEIIACLKRIHTSVRRWNKQGGRQGYLKFVDGFID